MSWDCGFKYIFAFSPTLKAGVMCKLQERDDIGRIELVQKLARENCQFLQTDKKEQEKSDNVSLFLLGMQILRGRKCFCLIICFKERIFDVKFFRFGIFFFPFIVKKKNDSYCNFLSQWFMTVGLFIRELFTEVNHVEI